MSFFPFGKWNSEVSLPEEWERGLINYGKDAAKIIANQFEKFMYIAFQYIIYVASTKNDLFYC
jgi:hypothetical protein